MSPPAGVRRICRSRSGQPKAGLAARSAKRSGARMHPTIPLSPPDKVEKPPRRRLFSARRLSSGAAMHAACRAASDAACRRSPARTGCGDAGPGMWLAATMRARSAGPVRRRVQTAPWRGFVSMVAPSAPRDARSKIPPGPEGSNGIDRRGRRGQPAGPSPFGRCGDGAYRAPRFAAQTLGPVFLPCLSPRLRRAPPLTKGA